VEIGHGGKLPAISYQLLTFDFEFMAVFAENALSFLSSRLLMADS
jgi:hypothetical protein